MVEDKAENKSLEHFRFDKHIIRQIISQLKKDIELSGGFADIDPGDDPDLFVVIDQLAAYLQSLKSNNSTLYYSLLYRVDIPEELLTNHTEDTARLILKRILIKVLLRIKYS